MGTVTIAHVAVYCGSSPGRDPNHRVTAAAVGRGLAGAGIGVVYGGAHVGLMGALADAALAAGGTVTGVITDALVSAEVAHTGLTRLVTVGSMHERKRAMSDLADAFVMLPGGYGTLDEFLEALTWNQLGIHAKPCAVLDPTGYFTPLLALLDAAVEERFLTPANRALVTAATDIDGLLAGLRSWTPPPGAAKWLDRAPRP
jgi:uncharacterized protein (TIGR00730 family)